MLKSVFIIESVSPDDFYERRADGHAANEILKILGVMTEYRIAFTRDLVSRAIAEAVDGDFEVLHFSSHGSDEGVSLTSGKGFDWKEFAELVKPFSNESRKLVMATCGGGDVKLAKALASQRAIYGWVFGSTADRVSFSDTCLAWSVLYNRLYDHGFSKDALQPTLSAINGAIEGDFVYRRWDGSKFRRHPKKSTS
jgi:hypothetical protein